MHTRTGQLQKQQQQQNNSTNSNFYSHRQSASQDYARSKLIQSSSSSSQSQAHSRIIAGLDSIDSTYLLQASAELQQRQSYPIKVNDIHPNYREALAPSARVSNYTDNFVPSSSSTVAAPSSLNRAYMINNPNGLISDREEDSIQTSNYKTISDYQYQNLHNHKDAQQTPMTSSMPHSNIGNVESNKENDQANNNNSHMNKILAHSTSLLANDSYMAGMSSDSELTSGRHHHHRPYSSQSRVYHAHPAPRSAHSTSSRMSHYSDSAASYLPSCVSSTTSTAANAQKPPIHQGPGSVIMNNQTAAQHHLSHQGSMTSSGSGSSASAYLGNMTDQMSMIALQQQQQAPIRPGSGRQLPARPFKQSMSIDHHALGQYHQQQQQQQHQHYTQNPLSHLSSPVHPVSAMGSHNMDSALSESALGTYQSQQQPSSPSTYSHGQQQRVAHMIPHDQRYQVTQRTGMGMRMEMDMLEKQTSNISLYDKSSSQIGLPPQSSGWPTPASSSGLRQLPPTNLSSMSVDHSHYQQQQQQQMEHSYHPMQSQATDIPQHKSLQQHHQDLFGSHQVNSVPADWLPPMGPSAQHLKGPSQFKQAMSIDHFTAMNQVPSTNSYQTPAHFVNDPTGNQSYRPSSVNYVASSPAAFESPTHHSKASSAAGYNQQPSDQLHKDYAYSNQYASEQYHELPLSQNLPTQTPSQQAISVVGGSAGNYGKSTSRNKFVNSGSVAVSDKLHHQMSSSSSNSQSGSLRSSNIDISKTMSGNTNSSEQQHHQKTGTISQIQQQHQQQSHRQPISGVLRKGYTSALYGLSSSNNALDQYGGGGANDISSSSQQAYSSSSGPATAESGHRHRSALRAASPSLPQESSHGSSPQQHHYHHHGHHSSSSAKDGGAGCRSESSTGLPNGSGGNNSSSLTKKSNSATQLSMTGTKKRLGFRKKQVTSFSVHRSEEVAPLEARHLVKQGSSVSEGDSSMSGDSSSRSWSNSNFKQPTSDELASMSFIDGLGKGQMISRQGLASPYLGDIQLSLCDRRGNLEIEVIRARNLQAKTNKILPLTYVKLYLVKNRKCLAKAKTTLSNKRTLDPLFQQQLTFHEDYHGCILQSIIWGNFGKMDKKNFMGIAQISIDDLELSDTVISWYKLFLPSSLQTLPSKSLRHTLLSNSTESFTNTNNS